MNDQVQPDWLQNHVPAKNPGNPNWKKGVSGNPAGKPPGRSPHQKLVKRMLEEGGAVLDAMLARAKEGDPAAAGLVLSRILPTLRAQAQTVQFDFDPALPLSEQLAQVAVAVAGGQVSPDTGQLISAMLSNLANVRSSEHLEERILALEAKAVN